MTISTMLRTIAALALISASSAAFASQGVGPDGFAVRFLGKDPSVKKTSACFVRAYDGAHLAEHPKQKVTAMMLLVTGEPDGETKTVSYTFSMGVKLAGKSARFESAGGCSHSSVTGGEANTPASFACGVDCDGGGFAVTLSEDGKAALVKLDQSVAIWIPGKDGADERLSLDAGADDRVFQLYRVDASQCRPIAGNEAQAAREGGN